MSYTAAQRSERNQHAWGKPEPHYDDIDGGRVGWLYACERCGEWHLDLGFWAPQLPPVGGCVALPAPAVAPPVDLSCLPIPGDNFYRAAIGAAVFSVGGTP